MKVHRFIWGKKDCPKGCWQNCEYSTECFAEAKDNQAQYGWINTQLEKIVPYLKSILSNAFPAYGTLSIRIDYEGGSLRRITYSGVEENIPDFTESNKKDKLPLSSESE